MAFYLRLYVLFTLFLNLSLFAEEVSRERKLYIGKDSTEAVLTFEGYAETNREVAPSKEDIEGYLDYQVQHLFGPMGEADIKAVPRGEQKFTNISTPVKKAGTRNTYVIKYNYKGKIVVSNKAKGSYTVILPINPDTIYEEAKVGNNNPCTDHHYQEASDFWYFWSPDRYGCKLQEGVHYFKAEGKIQRIENTKTTYPEYNRLVRKSGSESKIHMSILFGMDDPSKNRDPLKSTDINASNFKDVRNSLIKLGYKTGKVWTSGEIEKYLNKNVDSNVYVEELTKTSKKGLLVARMFFGPSGMGEDSDAFQNFFKDAIERSSVMIYDGHSGLGAHLDLAELEKSNNYKIKFPKNEYQILYFNSCSSYTYYNTQYFKRKQSSEDPKGTKNMEILTNGLATYFSVMHSTNMAVLKAITTYADGKGAMSYQALANEIDSGNLFGINGDEDNSTKPPRD